MKNLHALLLMASLLGAARSLAMDSLDDNPAFLNRFFEERQEYLNQKNESRNSVAVGESNNVAAASKNFTDTKWCDSKPVVIDSTTSDDNQSGITAVDNFIKIWIVSIFLATCYSAIHSS